MDLTQALQFIQDSGFEKNRPMVVQAPDKSGRWWLLRHDDDHERPFYEEQQTFVTEGATVSTVESLLAVVRNWYARHEGDIDDGRVIFTAKGATFNPDVADGRHIFGYTRVLSHPWQTFATAAAQGNAETALTHREFLAVLRSLAPWIPDYTAIRAQYQAVTLTRNAKLTSAPLLVNGQRQGSYEFQVMIDGGEARVPAGFRVVAPYTRGGQMTYTLEMDVQIEESEGELFFTLTSSDLDTRADEAVMEEMAWFKSEAANSDLAGLLTVLNF